MKRCQLKLKLFFPDVEFVYSRLMVHIFSFNKKHRTDVKINLTGLRILLPELSLNSESVTEDKYLTLQDRWKPPLHGVPEICWK